MKVFTFRPMHAPFKRVRREGAPASDTILVYDKDGLPEVDMNELHRVLASCRMGALKGIPIFWDHCSPEITEGPGEGVRLVVEHHELPGGRVEL
jgi:hypothetical protein